MPMNFDTRFLLAAIQAAPDVAAAYSGTNLMPALELAHNPLQADRNTRDLVDGTPGNSGADYLSKPRVSITAAVEASASSALGTAPFWAALARAAGLEQALVAGVSASYTPSDADQLEMATLVGGFGGGQAAPGSAADFLQEALNASGTMGFQATEGGIPRLDFRFTAVYGAPVARSAIVAASPLDIGPLGQDQYREADPVTFENTSFSFAGQQLRLRDLSMSDDTPVVFGDRPNELSTRRGRRRYTGRMVVTAPALGTLDYFQNSLDGATAALLLRNGPAGNQFEFRADRVQAFLADLGEADNEVTATFDLLFLRDAATREFRITAQ